MRQRIHLLVLKGQRVPKVSLVPREMLAQRVLKDLKVFRGLLG